MSTISDRIVPRSGHGAWLVWLGAGAMAFLAVFTLALSVSAERLADSWSAALAQSATVRISAPPAELNAQTDATLEVLRTTPGIDDARVMSAQEQADLLAVWLGPDLPLDALPLPRMIEVFESAEGPDRQGLRLRLSAEAPGAIYDDHTQWRRPLIEAAARLRALSLLALALIGGVTGAIIALAASAALASNAQVIRVLRLVGARDRFIARAFVRRMTHRAALGATIGTALGMVSVMGLPSLGPEATSGLGFQGASWLAPLAIPILAALVAWAAAMATAFAVLRGVT
ncbi:MAG: cell division transport system permease protein FtsX [Roseibaca calidilacus]|uniref:Cell division transport system permease protein n=1 Tax=Roseibaca calidilacus TaxID=1666912 RepID=A0A0P7W9E1_9RHOB|nr:cell division protein FtsX [Roseibaca calidilacus]KPP90770.1 MAG: cell division transport system permease protein FtsX [Roseibaca calidilacus]CUX83534.1 cell division transport system permease protein [Roseibaca calidilacus]